MWDVLVRLETALIGWCDTPVGPINIAVGDGGIISVGWGIAGQQAPFGDPVLSEAFQQLGAYFDGARRDFDLPLAPKASEFQRKFHDVLCAIPFGDTRRYGDIAKELGVSAQAIGQACGANPIPIIIPCHRVLGANGLGGYSGDGGVDTKVWLLRHEGAGGLLI